LLYEPLASQKTKDIKAAIVKKATPQIKYSRNESPFFIEKSSYRFFLNKEGVYLLNYKTKCI
jgi:hypothetical protein